MRKVFFYTFWKCQKLEEFLGHMEKKGFRLVGVSLSYIFYFKEAKSKDTRYVYVTSFPKDISFYDNENKIKTEFNADPIPIRNSGLMEVYRICDRSADLSDFFINRQRYFLRVAANKLFANSVLMMTCILFLRLSFMNSRVLASVLFALLTIAGLYLTVYYLYGLVWLWRKQSKK